MDDLDGAIEEELETFTIGEDKHIAYPKDSEDIFNLIDSVKNLLMVYLVNGCSSCRYLVSDLGNGTKDKLVSEIDKRDLTLAFINCSDPAYEKAVNLHRLIGRQIMEERKTYLFAPAGFPYQDGNLLKDHVSSNLFKDPLFDLIRQADPVEEPGVFSRIGRYFHR